MSEEDLKHEYVKDSLQAMLKHLNSAPGVDIYQMEAKREFEKWRHILEAQPPIEIPDGCYMQVIPPFCGAIVRFMIKHRTNEDVRVSVYLDCYNALGYCNGPYWEVYPFGEDIRRVGIEEIEELNELIAKSVAEQLETEKTDGN